MCIICNCPENGDIFLNSFAGAQIDMKKAAKAMLACSNEAKLIDQRKKYDVTHKKIVRLIREWNSLEMDREHYK